MDHKDVIAGGTGQGAGDGRVQTGLPRRGPHPGMDKVAAYGIGGLVAGKVMAKAALFAAALIFLKKFGVLIVLGLGALVAKRRRMAI